MAQRGTKGRTANIGLILLVVMMSLTTVPAASADTATDIDDDDDPSLVIALESNGDAEVELTLVYDLTNDEERDAFESLEGDTEAQETASDRFEERMQSLAADASEQTERDMDVSDSAISLRTVDDGDTGVVELSVRWFGLAEVDEDQLHVDEPFASGYETDRAFSIIGPEGFDVVETTPSGSATTENSVTWPAETDLSGLSVTFEGSTAYTSSDDAGMISEEQPGFGVVVAVIALLGSAVVLLRRQES